MEDVLDCLGVLRVLSSISPNEAEEQDASEAKDTRQHGSPNSRRAEAALEEKDQRRGGADHLELAESEAEDRSFSMC